MNCKTAKPVNLTTQQFPCFEETKMTMQEFYRAAIERSNTTGETLEEIVYGNTYNPHANLPDGYAEVEYADFENAEAISGARWDDLNYRHYMER